jgi:mRNA interferase RelE/StbE
MFSIRILEGAARDLARLDAVPARRIVTRIRWLAENVENIRPETLKGDLAGLFKLREGDYRIVYQILHDQKFIVIHFIGQRREVYRKR